MATHSTDTLKVFARLFYDKFLRESLGPNFTALLGAQIFGAVNFTRRRVGREDSIETNHTLQTQQK